MEHSIESHTRCVNELCRICGNLCCVTKKQKKNNDRALIATDMFLIYGIKKKRTLILKVFVENVSQRLETLKELIATPF